MLLRHGSHVLAFLLVALVIGALPERAAGQDNRALPFTMPLWPEGAPGAVGDTEADRPTLTAYLPTERNATGTSVVVCPGGGYATLAIDHEGHEVAEWLNTLGVAAFVLKYRHGMRYHHPTPLQDAQRAIRIVRHRAKTWGLSPERIGILGFSAGGHLASTAATHVDEGAPNASDPVRRISSRPDFVTLIYPVVSMIAPYTHQGSKRHLLGEAPDSELATLLSNEQQVTASTPPTFMVHASDDRVSVKNSIDFYLALQEAGVPVEMHVFETGGHGYGLAPHDPVLSHWPEQWERWLRKRGLLTTRR